MSSEQGSRTSIIIGSGPAGYTAALYTARADLEPLVIEGFAWGGLLQQTTDVENYPGFPDGIMGPEMMQRLPRPGRALRHALHHRRRDAGRARRGGRRHPPRLRRRPGDPHARRDPRDGRRAEEARRARRGRARRARRLLLRHLRRRLLPRPQHDRGRRRRHRDGGGDLPGQVRRQGRRSSTAATSSAPRRSWSTARATTENIEFLTPVRGRALRAGRERRRSARRCCATSRTARSCELEVTGAFIGIGHKPNSQLVEGQLDMRRERLPRGRGALHAHQPCPGVFAAGDLTDHIYRQAVTAAGTGCVAALDAEAYLRDTPIDAEAHWAPDPDKVEARGASRRRACAGLTPAAACPTWTNWARRPALRARARGAAGRARRSSRGVVRGARTLRAVGLGSLVHRHRLHRRRARGPRADAPGAGRATGPT